MINLFLKFDNESAWREYATSTGILTQGEEPVLDDDGNETGKTQTVDQWQYFSLNHAISDIGILYNKDGQYDPETGEEIKAPTAKEGWHVNWKASQFPDGITAFEPSPHSDMLILRGMRGGATRVRFVRFSYVSVELCQT